MKLLSILGLLTITLSSVSFAQSDMRPFLAVPYVQKAPVIDGHIDNAEWDATAGVWGFIGENGNLFPKPVSAKLAWSATGLYICFVTSQNSLRAENSADSTDALVSSDDAVEIFLQSKPNTYNHFIANSIGAKYDARGTDASWNCNWVTASAVSGNTWTVEIFIPYSSEVPKPNAGDEWSFNLCRDFKDPIGWTSLASMGGSFHNPSAFGKIRFVKNIPGVSIVSLDTPRVNGSSLRLKAISTADKSIKIKWSATAVETGQGLGSGEVQSTIKADNLSDIEIPLVVPVPPITGKNHRLSIEISSTDGTLLQKRVIGFVPSEDVSLKIQPNRKLQNVTVTVDTTGLKGKASGKLRAIANLNDSSGKVLKTCNPVDVDGQSAVITLDMSGLNDGNYGITVDISSEDGQLVGTKSAIMSRYELPDWKGSKIGLDDNVPFPWIPLKLTGSKLSCWNRNYDFGTNGLLARITAGGKELLAGPMILDGAVDGKRLRWKPVSSKTISKAKGTVVLLKQQKTDTILMSSKITCDFDGMIRFDVTLKPAKPGVKINKLALRVPIPEQFAKYHYNYAYTFGGGKGATQPTSKDMIGKLDTPWRSEFQPGMWIGNASTGIGWFAEGKMNWNQTQPGKALEVVQQGTSRVLIVNFVDTDTNLIKPITLTFGMQATPTKPFPRPKDWLTFRPVEMVGNKLFFCGWGGDTRWEGFPIIGNHKAKSGDPNEFDDKGFIEGQKKLRARGLTLPMYLNPATAVTDMPELIYYREQWKNTPEIVTGTDTGQEIVLVCGADKDWQDLYIKRLQQFMNKYDVDATYMDWSYCQRCSNAEHGCGYTNPDGTREATWPIFAMHELHKRIYKVMKAAKPKSPLVTLAHPVGAMCLPHTNFWDAYVEGEYINVDIRGPKYAGDYTAFYTPERFTAEYNGRNWGSIPLFMAYVSEPAKSRTIFAMALMTGAVVWPAYLDWSTQISTWNALDKFGVDKIEEFLPYWDNKGAVKWTGGDKVFITTYRNKGKAMLVVSNLGPDAAAVSITINQKLLKTTGLTITDPITETKLSENKPTISLEIPAKDFKLLVVE